MPTELGTQADFSGRNCQTRRGDQPVHQLTLTLDEYSGYNAIAMTSFVRYPGQRWVTHDARLATLESLSVLILNMHMRIEHVSRMLYLISADVFDEIISTLGL